MAPKKGKGKGGGKGKGAKKGPAVLTERDKWKHYLNCDGWALANAPDTFKADPELVKVACQQDGRALEFATPDLQADRDIVTAACKQNGCEPDRPNA